MRAGKELEGHVCKVCGRQDFRTLNELQRHFHQLHERELFKVQQFWLLPYLVSLHSSVQLNSDQR